MHQEITRCNRSEEEQLYLLSARIYAAPPGSLIMLREGTLEMSVDPGLGTQMRHALKVLEARNVIAKEPDVDQTICYRKLADGFGDAHTFSPQNTPWIHIKLCALTEATNENCSLLNEFDFNGSREERIHFIVRHLEYSIKHARNRSYIPDDVASPDMNLLVGSMTYAIDRYFSGIEYTRIPNPEPLHLINPAVLTKLAVEQYSKTADKEAEMMIYIKPPSNEHVQFIIQNCFNAMRAGKSYQEAILLKEDKPSEELKQASQGNRG